jgi:hypothetical protein
VPIGRVLFDPPIMFPEPELPVPPPVEPPGAVVVVEFEHPVNANIAVSTISATAATLKRTSLMSSHLPVPRVAGQSVRIPRAYASIVELPARSTWLVGGALHAEVPAPEPVL